MEVKNGIELTGTLYTSAQGEAKDKLAYAQLIWDDELAKKQSEINKELRQSLADTLDYTVNGKKISTNPVLAKNDVGLDKVDNTTDLDKPISTATQTALDGLGKDIEKISSKLLWKTIE